jgi:hypothetical protein
MLRALTTDKRSSWEKCGVVHALVSHNAEGGQVLDGRRQQHAAAAAAAAAADARRAKNSIELVTQSKGWGGFDGDESNLFLGDLIFDI